MTATHKQLLEDMSALDELMKYVDLDGPTSHTEALELACRLAGYPDYIPDFLHESLMGYIEGSLHVYKSEYEISERKENITRTVGYLKEKPR